MPGDPLRIAPRFVLSVSLLSLTPPFDDASSMMEVLEIKGVWDFEFKFELNDYHYFDTHLIVISFHDDERITWDHHHILKEPPWSW